MEHEYDSMHPTVSDVAMRGEAALHPMRYGSMGSVADEINRLREAENVCRTSAVIMEARHRAEMYHKIASLAEEETEAMRRERDEWREAHRLLSIKHTAYIDSHMRQLRRLRIMIRGGLL